MSCKTWQRKNHVIILNPQNQEISFLPKNYKQAGEFKFRKNKFALKTYPSYLIIKYFQFMQLLGEIHR